MAGTESAGPKLYLPIKYKCSFAGCDLQFHRKDRCESHEFTHSNERKFKCNEPNCDKAYITNCHLNRHKRTTHSKSTEPIACINETCTQFFTSKEQMEVHCRTVHRTESLRCFQCDKCPEKFSRKTHLKQHMVTIHTGNYQFTCKKCGKGYLLLSRLKRHEKVSHKTHTCQLCAITFEKWSLLLAHKQRDHTNTELKCNICAKMFNSRRCLKEHSKVHVNINERNEIPCTFDGCKKFFFRRSNMLAHFKLKHENCKFVCTFENCQLELSTKQKLNQHINVIHLGEMGQKKSKRKLKSEHAKRKDAGMQKKSTASKLFNIILPPEFEKAIISGRGKNIEIQYDGIDGDAGDDKEADEQRTEAKNGQSDNEKYLGVAVINSTGAVIC